MTQKKAWFDWFGSRPLQLKEALAYRKALSDRFKDLQISKEFMPLTNAVGNSKEQQLIMRLNDLAVAALKHRDKYYALKKRTKGRYTVKPTNSLLYDLYTNKAKRFRQLAALYLAKRKVDRRNGKVELNPIYDYMQKDNSSLRTWSNIAAPLMAVNQGLRDNLLTGWLVRGINAAGGLFSPYSMSWDNAKLDQQLRLNVYKYSTMNPAILTLARVAGQLTGGVADSMIGGGILNAGKAFAATRAANAALNGASRGAKILNTATQAAGRVGNVVGKVVDPGSMLWKVGPQSASGWGRLGRSLLGAGVNYGVDTAVVNPAMNYLVNNDVIDHNTALAILQAGNFIRGAHAQGFADPGAKQDLDDAIEASARYRAAMKNGYKTSMPVLTAIQGNAPKITGKIDLSPLLSAKHFALTGEVNGSPALASLDDVAVNRGFNNASHIAHSTLLLIPGVNIPVRIYNKIRGRQGNPPLKSLPANPYNQNPYAVGFRAANHWAPGGHLLYVGLQLNQRHRLNRILSQLAFNLLQSATNAQMRSQLNKLLADMYKVQYAAERQNMFLQQQSEPLIRRMLELQNKAKLLYLSQALKDLYARVIDQLQNIDNVRLRIRNRLMTALNNLSLEAKRHGILSAQMAKPTYTQTAMLDPMYRASIADHAIPSIYSLYLDQLDKNRLPDHKLITNLKAELQKAYKLGNSQEAANLLAQLQKAIQRYGSQAPTMTEDLLALGQKYLNNKAKDVSWGTHALVNTPGSVSLWTQAALPGGLESQALMYAPLLAGLFKDVLPDSAVQFLGKSVMRPLTTLQNILGSTIWHNPGITNNYVPFTNIRVNDAQLLGSPALRDLTLSTNMGALAAANAIVPKAQQAFLNRLRGVPYELMSDYDKLTFSKIYLSLQPLQQHEFVKSTVGALPNITNISALISLRNMYSRLKATGGLVNKKFADDVLKYITQHFSNQINSMPGLLGQILRLLISLGLVLAPGYSANA